MCAKLIFQLIFVTLIFFSCKKEKSLENTNCSEVSTSYATDIKPLVQVYCQNYGCHNAGDANGDFSTYNGLKSKVDNGSLSNRVIQRKDMPRPDLRKLSIQELKKIKCWLDSGAPDN
jgi:hypothetical protein